MLKNATVRSASESRVLRWALAGFAVHCALMVGIATLRLQEPRKDLRLTTSSSSIILWGKTSMGFNHFKLFGSWNDFEKYMAAHQLSLPVLAAAFQSGSRTAEVIALNSEESLGSSGASEKHKVIWVAQSRRNVIITPDLQSALILRDYAAFHGLEKSLLGYSLPLSQN